MISPLPRAGMDDAVRAIRDARTIALACHVNPDGDALGSMIGLGLGLDALGKQSVWLSADGVPDTLRFLPASDRVVQVAPEGIVPTDLSIVLDAGELGRVGTARATIEAAPMLMDVDHHVTAGAFGQIRLLDATAAATAEIVYDLLLALEVEITLPIAQCLLCGLLTDTGSFRFMNVTPRTMTLAGELIGLGASPNTIAECVFENKPFAAQKLLGRALDSMRQSADERIVWAHVTAGDYAAFATDDTATDGIVNAIRAVRGADVAILLREMATGDIRVSLRARPPVDVSQIAARFGGGGHRLASGCTLQGPLADAEANLIATVAQALATLPATPAGDCADA